MSIIVRVRTVAGVVAAIGVVAVSASLAAQPAGETFSGTASVKSPAATASSPVTIKIDRFLTEAERDKIVSVVKANDHAATRKALAAMPDIGYIDVAKTRTPIKYAYFRSTGAGRMVTVVTAQPVLHLGGNLPNAKPKEGYDLALALMILDGSDKGDGEFAPAVKLKVDENGAIVTDDYGSEVVRLVGMSKAK